jgi:TonB family protein
VPNSDKEWSGTFTTFGEKPRSGFNFFKVLVPVGLAAVLALTAWLYTTKWRQANAEPMQASTPQNTQPVIDPITAASQAQTAAATNIPAPLPENSKTTGEIQPASLSTAPAAAKPMAPKTEDSEVEVETSGPKPLVVQNAGALPQARLAEPARAEAPQLMAAAGAIPVPALDVKGSLPKLQAKQSSLIPNQLMRSVPPVYPETARRLGLKGAVTVEAQVAPDGSVKSVKALDGEPLLAKAAETAVKQWKYRPSYLNGEPVASTARIVLNFKPPAQ